MRFSFPTLPTFNFKFHWPALWVGAASAAIMGLIWLILTGVYHQYLANQQAMENQSLAASYQADINLTLQQWEKTAQTIRAFTETELNATDTVNWDEFQVMSRILQNSIPGLLEIHLRTPNGAILYLADKTISTPAPDPSQLKLIPTGSTVYGPVKTTNGSSVVWFCETIRWTDGWGPICILTTADTLWSQSGLNQTSGALDISILAGEKTIYGSAGSNVRSILLPVGEPLVDWQMAATPAAGWQDRNIFTEVFFTFLGVLVAVLTGLIGYQFMSRQFWLNQAVTERTHELADSEDKYRRLFETSTDAILIETPEGRVVDCNTAACALYGYTKEEMCRLNLTDLIPDSLSETLPEIQEMEWVNQNIRHESYGLDRSGRIFPTEISTNQAEINGEQRLIVYVRDITNRRQAENYLLSLVDAAPLAIYTLDLNDCVLTWNPAAERMFGWNEDEIIGKPLPTIPPEKSEEFHHLHARVRNNEPIINLETQRICKDGRMIHVSMSVAPIRDENGQLISSTTILQDITERKQSEEQLILLKKAVEAAANGILITNQNGVIEWANPAFTDLTGFPAEEVIGSKPSFLNSKVQTREFYDNMWETIRSGKVWHDEIVNQRKNGSLYIEEMTITPVRLNGKNEYSHYIAIKQDVSERHQREREQNAVIEVAAALRAVQSKSDIVQIVLDQLMRLMDAVGTSYFANLPEKKAANCELGLGCWTNRTGLRMTQFNSLTAQIIAVPRTYMNNNALAREERISAEVGGEVRCLAAAPLIIHNNVLGILWVGRDRDFNTGDVRILSAIADIAASALQRASLDEDATTRIQRLDALHQIDYAINSNLNLNTTLEVVVDQIRSQLAADAADILLFDQTSNKLRYAVGSGFSHSDYASWEIRLGEGCPGQCAAQHQWVRCSENAVCRSPHCRERMLAEGFRGYYTFPLISKGQVKGVLEVFHHQPFHAARDWLEFLETLASSAAVAIDNNNLLESLQLSNQELAQAYDTTLEGWAYALDLRDNETEGHSRRVTDLTLELGQAYGLDAEEMVQIRRGALLHDIGKLAIPDAILLKPGPLTDDEWKIMRRHPVIARDLLQRIPYLQSSLTIPYYHHERWDGSGYPLGLHSEAIPLPARLFAVVDIWDALSNDRPYRKAWDEDRVMTYLESQAGVQLDPRAVQTFFHVRGNGRVKHTALNGVSGVQVYSASQLK